MLPAQREVRTVLCFGLADPNGDRGAVHRASARRSRCPAPCICMPSSPSASPTRKSPMPAPRSPPSGSRISRPPPAIAPAGSSRCCRLTRPRSSSTPLRSRIFWDEVRTLKMFQNTERAALAHLHRAVHRAEARREPRPQDRRPRAVRLVRRADLARDAADLRRRRGRDPPHPCRIRRACHSDPRRGARRGR